MVLCLQCAIVCVNSVYEPLFSCGSRSITRFFYSCRLIAKKVDILISGATPRIFCTGISDYVVVFFAGSSDSTARLWSVETGEIKREYSGHQKTISAIAFRDVAYSC